MHHCYYSYMENAMTTYLLTEVKCPICGYVWHTRSKMMYICCPRCYRKFRSPLFLKDDADLGAPSNCVSERAKEENGDDVCL